MISNVKKAVIHVAKSQLGLDDDAYRDVLQARAGVGSSKDLDGKGFLAVMKHFEACGFENKGSGFRVRGSGFKGKVPRPGPQQKRRANMATDKQVKKIYAMWWAMPAGYYEEGKQLQSLRGFLKNRFRVDHENFLTFATAHSVIEALKAIGVRQKA